MKYVFVFIIVTILNSAVIGQQQTPSLYQLSFAGLDKDQINMSDYKGKKIIVVECDAAKPDKQELLFLDSLYKSRKSNLVVIAIPVEDFGQTPQEKELKKLWRDTLKLSFPVAKISKAKKANGAAQHKLLNWLTNKNQNNHFEEDVDADGQAFVISESGSVYSCLKDKKYVTNTQIINLILEQKPQDN